MSNLFVYGTLLIPQMVVHLGLKVPMYIPATVTGYRKISTERLPFPLLVEDQTGVLVGAIWPNITKEAFKVLVEYEGPYYDERRVWAQDQYERLYDCTTFFPKEMFKAGWEPQHAFDYWTKAANTAKEVV